MKVEFIYEKTCPNVEATREQLVSAFDKLQIMPVWQEWEVSNPDAPAYIHGYGSPTILVDGMDLLGATPAHGDMNCRIYPDSASTNKGVPSAHMIIAALRLAAGKRRQPQQPVKKLFGLNIGLLPTIGVALLPKLFCPACWPAYAGLLSSLGLGFFDYTPYLLPFMALFIVVSLSALGYRASVRHGYMPLILGVVAGLVLLVSKFYFDLDWLMWLGIAMLVGASIWNSWPTRATQHACPACQH